MSVPWTRREILGAGVALTVVPLVGCSAAAQRAGPVTPQVTGGVFALGRELAAVPTPQLAGALVDRFDAGLAVNQAFAATFAELLATVSQEVLEHTELAVAAASVLAGEDRRRAVALLANLRALNDASMAWYRENIGEPSPYEGPVAAAGSEAELVAALAAYDEAAAEGIVVGLYRNSSEAEVRDVLWRVGARDFTAIGHRQIAVSHYLAMAKTIGWDSSASVVRGLIRRLCEPGDDAPPDDELAKRNEARVDAMSPAAPPSAPRRDDDARSVIAELRALDADAAAAKLGERASTMSWETLWDALVLLSLEPLLAGGPDEDGFKLHCFTTTNALRSGAGDVASTRTQLFLLLQAASFVASFPRRVGVGVRPLSIEDLAAAPSLVVSDGAGVVAMLGRGRLRDDGVQAPDEPIEQARQLEVATQLAALLDADPSTAAGFRAAALDTMARKAGNYHEHKFLNAVFEEADRVGATLRTSVLVASLFYLNGPDTRDVPSWAGTELALARL